MEKAGGAFLLQDTQPTKLIGSLVSGIDEQGHGWLHIAFFQEKGVFELSGTERLTLTMSRAVTLSMISLLSILLAQLQWLRETSTAENGDVLSSFSLSVTTSKTHVGCTWPVHKAESVVSEVDGQLEIRLSEGLGKVLLQSLVRELGRVAAGT